MPTDKQQIQNPFGAPPLVQQMAQQSFAMQNGGVAPIQPQQPQTNFFANGGGVSGRFESSAAQQPQQQVGTPPYDAQTGLETPQPQTNFENMPKPSTGWNPDGSARHDALSEALSGYKHDFNQPQPEFKKDDSKRDGGFFSWLRGLAPKLRPGRRDGETEDEYDRRMTTNRERLLAFGDAMRHIGNIVNTGKGAPSQQFNDPISQEEGRYQQRKAERQRKAALDAENVRQAAELGLKEKAAEADRQYKLFLMGMKNDAAGLNRDKFEYQKGKDAASAQRQAEQDKQKQVNWERLFKFREQQAAITNSLRQQSINKRGSERSGGGSGRGSGGSDGGYSLYNPETGQTEHFKNEKSWIARAAELGYKTDTPSSSTTSQEVVSVNGTKKVSNTTRGNSVATQIGKQTAQKKAAAKGKAGGGKPVGNSKKKAPAKGSGRNSFKNFKL